MEVGNPKAKHAVLNLVLLAALALAASCPFPGGNPKAKHAVLNLVLLAALAFAASCAFPGRMTAEFLPDAYCPCFWSATFYDRLLKSATALWTVHNTSLIPSRLATLTVIKIMPMRQHQLCRPSSYRKVFEASVAGVTSCTGSTAAWQQELAKNEVAVVGQRNTGFTASVTAEFGDGRNWTTT